MNTLRIVQRLVPCVVVEWIHAPTPQPENGKLVNISWWYDSLGWTVHLSSLPKLVVLAFSGTSWLEGKHEHRGRQCVFGVGTEWKWLTFSRLIYICIRWQQLIPGGWRNQPAKRLFERRWLRDCSLQFFFLLFPQVPFTKQSHEMVVGNLDIQWSFGISQSVDDDVEI